MQYQTTKVKIKVKSRKMKKEFLDRIKRALAGTLEVLLLLVAANVRSEPEIMLCVDMDEEFYERS